MDADVGVRLEVDAVVLLQRIRRGCSPSPRGRGLPGGSGGWGSSGEARAAPREGGVAVEVRRQHGELVSVGKWWREGFEWRFLSEMLL